MRDRIMEVVLENTDTDQVERSTVIADVCDSLDVLNIVWDVENEFGCEIEEQGLKSVMTGGTTIGEFVDRLCDLVSGKR